MDIGDYTTQLKKGIINKPLVLSYKNRWEWFFWNLFSDWITELRFSIDECPFLGGKVKYHRSRPQGVSVTWGVGRVDP